MDDLPIFVDEPPDYEPKGDHIMAKWKGRDFHIPIAVAQKMVLRLREALAKWHMANLDEGSVIEFPTDH